MKKDRFVVRGVAVGGAMAVGYLRLLRPWQLGWGSTEEERGRPLTGDDLVAEPTFAATRAITIRAHPADVWPWLAQVGVNRAGWYSYDWLDNLGRPSAREIIPELLDIKVGDVMPMSPDGKHGIPVHALDPPVSMVWGTPGDTSWVWVLEEGPDGTTRVITRIRSRYRWLSPSIAFSMLLEFADIWMIRRMLLNLRERIEATGGTTTRPTEAARHSLTGVHVRNVHQRAIGSPERLGAMLDTLGSAADGLWPGERWPRMRLDGPLGVGARGGHGPIRYRVESYHPSRQVRFRFERPRGFDGVHQFSVVDDEEASARLVHVLDAKMTGVARLTWPTVFRPLHDALIEDALDNAEREITGQLQDPARWSRHVKTLRWALTAVNGYRVRRDQQAGHVESQYGRSAPKTPVRRVAQTLPVAVLLHDLEEVLVATWWSRHGTEILTHAQPWLPTVVVRAATRTTSPQMAVATSIVGLGVTAVSTAALAGRRDRPLRAATVVFAAHGITHLTSALAVRNYTPGAATAALVVLPWGTWALHLMRASDWRDRATRRRDTAAAAAGTIAVAITGHLVGRRVIGRNSPGFPFACRRSEVSC